jgi:plasmid stabilization system protein ParE
MKRYSVVIAPSARGLAETIVRWLEENHGTSEIFQGELEGALIQISAVPESAPVYRESRGRAIRRLLLPRSSYHAYFQIDEEHSTATVVALWHTSRGDGPDLT